jgi:hypothetical protein
MFTRNVGRGILGGHEGWRGGGVLTLEASFYYGRTT